MNKDLFNKIYAYCSGEMSPEEKAFFQAEMDNNEELSSAVKIYKVIEVEMGPGKKNTNNEIALRGTLEELNHRYFTNESKLVSGEENASSDILKSKKINVQEKDNSGWFVNRNLGKLAIAAVFIGMVMAGIIWYSQKTGKTLPPISKKIADSEKQFNSTDSLLRGNASLNNTTEKAEDSAGKNLKKDTKISVTTPAVLYAKYFKPDSSPSQKEGPLEEAFTYYDNKKYDEALAAIDAADINVETRGEDADNKLISFYAQYYKAIINMAKGNIQAAIPELENLVEDNPGHSFQIKLQWYLSLAYIKTGELKKAKNLLHQIADYKQSSLYKDEAQNILDELMKSE